MNRDVRLSLQHLPMPHDEVRRVSVWLKHNCERPGPSRSK